MLQRPMAAWLFSLGKMRSISVWESGIKGPPQKPRNPRNSTSMFMLVAMPQSSEKRPNSMKQTTNTRMAPNREASQPVSGTEIASATA